MSGTSMIGPEDVFHCYMTQLEEITTELENALAEFSSGEGNIIQPVRSSISVKKYDGLLLTMPAYSETNDSLVTKLVTVYPGNAEKNLPTVQSNVLLFNTKTGSFNCMVDGNMLTALRTAHVSAIATKHLASGPLHILVILGAGTQSKSHIQIFSAMFQFNEIRIWNHRLESAEKLVRELQKEYPTLRVVSSAEEAVKDADVVITATLSREPILKAHWIKPGAHINAVGACDPTWQELDVKLMTSSTVYVDSKEAALVEAGDIILSKANVYAEIGEVIAKKVNPVPGKVTVFKSLGMAIEDAVTANSVYKHFMKK